MSKHIPISFEFFPTKTDAGAEKLKVVHQELQLLNPEFFSITYGAGGSTRERTLAAIAEFNGKGTPVAPHLSCIGDDKARIAELLDIYKDQGIDRIVALRGDLPSGQVGLGELPYATDLVRFIREHSPRRMRQRSSPAKERMRSPALHLLSTLTTKQLITLTDHAFGNAFASEAISRSIQSPPVLS